MAKLLMVVSSARTIRLADGSDHPTGYRAEEVRKPYEAFVAAGVDVVIATPDGKVPRPDPWGLEPFFHYPQVDEVLVGDRGMLTAARLRRDVAPQAWTGSPRRSPRALAKAATKQPWPTCQYTVSAACSPTWPPSASTPSRPPTPPSPASGSLPPPPRCSGRPRPARRQQPDDWPPRRKELQARRLMDHQVLITGAGLRSPARCSP
jgi:hypothetical protein